MHRKSWFFFLTVLRDSFFDKITVVALHSQSVLFDTMIEAFHVLSAEIMQNIANLGFEDEVMTLEIFTKSL